MANNRMFMVCRPCMEEHLKDGDDTGYWFYLGKHFVHPFRIDCTVEKLQEWVDTHGFCGKSEDLTPFEIMYEQCAEDKSREIPLYRKRADS